jgi:hypothetical protein
VLHAPGHALLTRSRGAVSTARGSIPDAPCGASVLRASSPRRLHATTFTGLARPTTALALCLG